MRHRKAGLKLNRTPSHRDAMFRNMVTSLFKHDRIRTTDTKAKAIRRWADHLITLAKRGDLHARRQALSIMREKEVVHKLFEQADDRFGDVSGGYTRVVKLGNRPGDAAPTSVVELTALEDTKKKKSKKKKPKAAAKQKKQAVNKETSAKKASATAKGAKTEEKKSADVKPEPAPADKKKVSAKEPEKASPEQQPVTGEEEASTEAAEKPPADKTDTDEK